MSKKILKEKNMILFIKRKVPEVIEKIIANKRANLKEIALITPEKRTFKKFYGVAKYNTILSQALYEQKTGLIYLDSLFAQKNFWNAFYCTKKAILIYSDIFLC